MQILIDITEDHYKTLQKMAEIGLGYYYDAIINGKVLSDDIDGNFDELIERAFRNGISKGMHIGIAIGRFYEKHNITDKIPYELADEYNNMFETAMAECRMEED